jgi:hypothetical protein
MENISIDQYLSELKKSKKLDEKMIDLLIASERDNEDGHSTAEKIIKLIESRYAETKENKG